MPNLTPNSNSWVKEIEQNYLLQTYTFPTKDKYLDKDIKMQISIDNIILQNEQHIRIDDWTINKDTNGNVYIY